MEEQKGSGASVCARCGQVFVCGMQAGEEKCWCSSFPPVFAVPEQDGVLEGCYCPVCLQALMAERRGEA